MLYYCEQMFDSKEDLFDHVEIHSDIERNNEIMNRKRQAEKIASKPKLKKLELLLGFYKFRNANNNFVLI